MGKKGLNCLFFVLAIFGGTYMGLVFLYRAGNIATIIGGIIFVSLGLFFFIKASKRVSERKENYYGIFSGLFFWAVLGEVVEHLEILSLPDWHQFPILLLFVFLFVYFAIKNYLPTGVLFSLGHFTAIWVLHFIMVNQFNLLGKEHWSTYPTATIFAFLALFFAVKMTKSRTDSENMFYSLATLLAAWTVLEYIWGWRLIPGPWSLQ